MNELEVLELFIDEIETATSGFTVRMSGADEEHESAMVLLDNLSADRTLRSTNPFKGLARNDYGDVIGERLQFYYEARLDITVQDDDEVSAYQTRMDIKSHFGNYERNPDDLSEDVVLFELGRGGERNAEFEQTVFRIFKQTQSFHFEFVDEKVVDADVLSEIEDNL